MSKVEPRYIPIEQASIHLSLDKKTLRRMIARGELRGYRVGPRLIRVDRHEVDAMLQPIPTAGDAA